MPTNTSKPRRASNRQDRQRSILDLIGQDGVSSQQDIVRGLLDLGFETTQASVSRDIRALGLVKNGGRYVRASEVIGDGQLTGKADPVFALVKDIQPVGANLIVIRTAVGAANPVGVALDARQFPSVVGTVAGDDTLFVAVRSRADQSKVLGLLNTLCRLAV